MHTAKRSLGVLASLVVDCLLKRGAIKCSYSENCSLGNLKYCWKRSPSKSISPPLLDRMNPQPMVSSSPFQQGKCKGRNKIIYHLNLAQASIYKLSGPSTPSFRAVQLGIPSVSAQTRVPLCTPHCIPSNIEVHVDADRHMETDRTQTQTQTLTWTYT